jgi:hypothetical protein
MVPGSLDQQPAGVRVLALVIQPWDRESPEDDSDGTKPR